MKRFSLFLILAATAAQAQAPRTAWICSHSTVTKRKILVSFYTEAKDGKNWQCAVFAESDDQEGLTAFRSCAIGMSVKPLFSASLVCAYEADLKRSQLTKMCDWSDESSPAPPRPVYNCKAVETKE